MNLQWDSAVYLVAMYRQSRPTRLLIAALLAIGMTATTVCTPISARSLVSVALRSQPPHKSCCCGTNDCKCCGMGCCMREKSNRVPTSPLVPTRGDKDD